jgi:hypothetical protein
MADQKPENEPQHPPQQQPPQTAQPSSPKPDKDVKVPEFDLLTEGYDPAKLEKK